MYVAAYQKGNKSLLRGPFVFPLLFGFVLTLWPELISPFTVFEFWKTKGSFWEAVFNAWPWYVWGIAINIFYYIYKTRGYNSGSVGVKFVDAFKVSVYAGVSEEIVYRWILFFLALSILPFSNWLLGGFMDLELIRWLYQYALCPVANFFTFGYLEPYLMNGYGWVVGAAVISTSSSFRNGHAYQGLLGFINSWFFGMYMHYVVFKYGLLPAIFIHFLYDYLILSLSAVFTAIDNIALRRSLSSFIDRR